MPKRTLVFEASGRHGTYRIYDMGYDDRPARVLFAGRKAPQSGVAYDDEPEMLFDYTQRMLEIALSTQPSSILMIGGGAMTLPQALIEHLPNATVDVVEIDELLPRIAKEYFAIADDSRLTVYIRDGRSYLEDSKKTYDLILVDAFSAFTIPPELISPEAITAYKRHLTKRGIITINFIGRYATTRKNLAHTLYADFARHMKTVELYPADTDYPKKAEQNIILVATERPTLSLDYLQSSVVVPPTPR